MQQKSLNLKSIRISLLPIINSFIEKMKLQKHQINLKLKLS